MTTRSPAPPQPPCPGPRLGRRGLLLGLGAALALGRSRVAFGQLPAGGQGTATGEARLVVALLRGGLDGLAAVPAYGDPAFAALRGPLALPEPGQEGGALDLGGRFGLHSRFAALHDMYRAGEALVLHAVAGPWRVRSHFDAQDMLESGAAQRLDSGWLNRALTALPTASGGGRGAGGLAVGLDVPLLMRGPTPVRNYAPRGAVAVNDDLLARIEGLLAHDPALGPAIAQGREQRLAHAATLGGVEAGAAARGGGGLAALAGAAGRLMAAPGGPRVAALETGGFDTHNGQAGRLGAAIAALDAGLAALREGLGEAAWRRTAVLVVTEFGRTVRVNGTGGTDHGTAGAAFLLGGAVAGGRVLADWPGLGEGRLLEDRDLQPTLDLRAIAKGLLRDHLRLAPAAVAQAFPGSGGVAPLAGLVRAA